MIGIIPAAGTAERFGGLPKFMLPCAGGEVLFKRLRRLMSKAIPDEIITYAREENVDLIERRLSESHVGGVDTNTMTETVLKAIQYRKHDCALFGMPDTYFEDEQAFVKLAAALDDGADVAVGVFEARPEQHSQGGMCKIDNNHVIGVQDKMPQRLPGYDWIWGVLAWKPYFWKFLTPDMPHVGYGIMPVIHDNADVRAVKLDGSYYDCGTPERYFEMIRATTGEVAHV